MTNAQTRLQTTSPHHFIVIGASRAMVLQVLLGVHAFAHAHCLVICTAGTRFLRHSHLTSDYHETRFDGTDDDVLAERINRFADATRGATLIPADCSAIRLADRLRERLRVFVIPSPTAAQIDVFDDKWQFHQFCAQHSLRTPLSLFAADKHALDYANAEITLGLPFIVKPVSEDSSRGAYIISSQQQYQREILDNPAYRYAPLIVQRYIRGTDVGLNLLAVNGKVKALSIQQRINPARDGSRILFFDNTYLEHVAHVVAEESGYQGVMNIDARIEDGTGQVYLFESNPRFWRSHSASAWCGLNFVELSTQETCDKSIRKLTSGTADTYYHPMFRPALAVHALVGRGHRRRFARAMLLDTCTLAVSTRIVLVESIKSARRFLHTLRTRLKPAPLSSVTKDSTPAP